LNKIEAQRSSIYKNGDFTPNKKLDGSIKWDKNKERNNSAYMKKNSSSSIVPETFNYPN
jgi:hypothetical protein